MQKNNLLSVSILIAGALIAGAVIYSTGLKGSVPSAIVGEQFDANNPNPEAGPRVSLDLTSDDVILGDLNAPITIIEYSDFQCPFCGRFYSQTQNQIRENYVKAGTVKFVLRHFAFLGPESGAAAEAVECAKDQGKFWAYHDALIEAEIKDGREHNGNLNEDLFKSLASQLKMDVNSFSSCLKERKYAAKVKNDYLNGEAIGVQATPTNFVNGFKVQGALPYDYFENIIEQILSS